MHVTILMACIIIGFLIIYKFMFKNSKIIHFGLPTAAEFSPSKVAWLAAKESAKTAVQHSWYPENQPSRLRSKTSHPKWRMGIKFGPELAAAHFTFSNGQEVLARQRFAMPDGAV